MVSLCSEVLFVHVSFLSDYFSRNHTIHHRFLSGDLRAFMAAMHAFDSADLLRGSGKKSSSLSRADSPASPPPNNFASTSSTQASSTDGMNSRYCSDVESEKQQPFGKGHLWSKGSAPEDEDSPLLNSGTGGLPSLNQATTPFSAKQVANVVHVPTVSPYSTVQSLRVPASSPASAHNTTTAAIAAPLSEANNDGTWDTSAYIKWVAERQQQNPSSYSKSGLESPTAMLPRSQPPPPPLSPPPPPPVAALPAHPLLSPPSVEQTFIPPPPPVNAPPPSLSITSTSAASQSKKAKQTQQQLFESLKAQPTTTTATTSAAHNSTRWVCELRSLAFVSLHLNSYAYFCLFTQAH